MVAKPIPRIRKQVVEDKGWIGGPFSGCLECSAKGSAIRQCPCCLIDRSVMGDFDLDSTNSIRTVGNVRELLCVKPEGYKSTVWKTCFVVYFSRKVIPEKIIDNCVLIACILKSSRDANVYRKRTSG